MKAAVLTEWKKIEYKEVPTPQVGEEECLVKVKYAGVCGSDVHIFQGHHPTAKAPVILGHEFVGVVEKMNTNKVTDIKVLTTIANGKTYFIELPCGTILEVYPVLNDMDRDYTNSTEG